MDWKNIKPNTQYEENFPRWQRVHDVVGGGFDLKRRDNEVPGTYLRVINPLDLSQYNRRLNSSYRKSAVFYNATSRTLAGLLGMLYRVEPDIIDLPDSMEYVNTDVDRNGMGINQQSHAVSSEVIQIGRHGLLTDMPVKEDGVENTLADVDNGFRPFIKRYNAVDITDWNQSVVSGALVLDLVVLRENTSEFSDEHRISRVEKRRYRILRLVDGRYTQQLWVEDQSQPEEELIILDGSGKSFDEIPFVFVGSENNDPNVDAAPLESLADVNIGHYRNSADLEHSSFNLSAATPYIADNSYSSSFRNPDNKSSSVQNFGENSVIVMGSGGSAGFLQPSPNTLANDLSSSKEEQMVALGAQLISVGGGAETAEAVRIKKSADASTLSVIGVNISNGYTKSLGWIAKFLGVDFEGEYKLNSNFFDVALSAQERQQIVAEWQSGLYPVRLARKQLQASKIIPINEDLDMLQDEVDSELTGISLDAE